MICLYYSIENARLKRATNLTLFKLDALEQYGRRENLRIYGVPETNNNNDDGEDVVLRIAKFLQIDLQGMMSYNGYSACSSIRRKNKKHRKKA